MSKVPGISARDIARLDQAHAAGNADLDEMVAALRERIAEMGSTLAIAVLTAELQTDDDPMYLAAVAGLAVGRLAQMPAEPEPAPKGRAFVEGFQPAAPVVDE